MGTRTIRDWRDRLVTILIAPLMTCSARLPVYALLIGAFIPDRVGGPVQPAGPGAVCLYLGGMVSGAMAVAGGGCWRAAMGVAPLMMEAAPRTAGPACATWPRPVERAMIFLRRVAASSWPSRCCCGFVHHPGAAGGRHVARHRIQLCRPRAAVLEHDVRAHRFNWQICHCPGARHGGARGGGERPGHGVRPVGRATMLWRCSWHR